jgi:hypothetical protein
MQRHLVPRGVPSTSFRIHHGGVLPKTVIVAMVSNRAMEGDYLYNPFNFHHFYVKNISLTVNGEKVPTSGLETDFEKLNAHVSRAYHWMYENTGAASSDKGNIVSWPAFQAGCFLVPFDLTPDLCNGLHTHNAEYGYIDLNLDFARHLPDPVCVLYELVFPKVLINDKVNSVVASLDVEA